LPFDQRRGVGWKSEETTIANEQAGSKFGTWEASVANPTRESLSRLARGSLVLPRPPAVSFLRFGIAIRGPRDPSPRQCGQWPASTVTLSADPLIW